MYWKLTQSRFLLILTCLCLVLALSAAPAAAAVPHQEVELEVIASGLNNPRGLAFAPDGSLFVAEAGAGGAGPCVQGPEGEACVGATGAITRIKDGVQRQVVRGLPSLAAKDGSGAIGPSDISGFRNAGAYVTIGLGGPPDVRSQLGPLGPAFAQLVHVQFSNHTSYIADIGAYEKEANPDGGEIDTNPNNVLALPDRGIVADAGGNALLSVTYPGDVSTIAVFPDRMVDAPPFLGLPPGTQIPMQAVPTSVALGPDGNLYVGQLTGFPFPVGGARVYQVEPGKDPVIFAEGFTNIMDLAFDSEGHLYVLEIAKNSLLSGDPTGALILVGADGSQTEIASEGLVNPGGLAIDAEGNLYISNYGTFAGKGEVVRIPKPDLGAEAPPPLLAKWAAAPTNSIFLPAITGQ